MNGSLPLSQLRASPDHKWPYRNTLQAVQECCFHDFRPEELAVLFNPVFRDLCLQSGRDEK